MDPELQQQPVNQPAGGGGDQQSVGGPGQQAVPQQSMRERYQAEAYARIGLDANSFATMDPIERNRLITGAYADMYMSNPDAMKWSGMAAYASDLVGEGMQQSYMLQAGDNSPLGALAMGAIGAPDGERVRELLAVGNAGVFDDLMWQHIAFQSGGIEELQRAAEAGEIPPEQLAGWMQINAGNTALTEARASGDQTAIDAANEQIWGGNNALLQYEQQVFLQNLVYDSSPEARTAFEFMSSGWNVLGLNSPIPGGESFGDFQDRTGATGTPDIGDAGQRWDWIRDSMAPGYRARETGDNASMMADMQRFSRGEGAPNTNTWGAATGAIDVLGMGASGAALGAGIGSLVPAVGTAIGAGIGGGAGLVVGGAQAVFGNEAEPNSGLEVPLVNTHITAQEGVGIAGMAGGGALTGAAIGSIVPALGTAIGAGAGALIGGAAGLIGSIWD
jgi:hypothetical protein